MPGFDGTGPRGQGPMTGGGRGYCAIPFGGAARPQPGRGYFFARGAGRGRRNRYYATGFIGWQRAIMPPQQEADLLKEEATFLSQQLENIQARIKELEANLETQKEAT